MICIRFSMLMRLKHWLFQGVRDPASHRILVSENGAIDYCHLGENERLPMMATGMRQKVFPTEVVDTVGAGDSHVGAFLSARLEGLDMTQALRFANKVSSQIVASKGVHLTKSNKKPCEQN